MPTRHESVPHTPLRHPATWAAAFGRDAAASRVIARRPGTSVHVRYDQSRRAFCINVLPIVAWAELLVTASKAGRPVDTKTMPAEDHSGWSDAIRRASQRLARYEHLSVLRSVYRIPLANGEHDDFAICDCLDVASFAKLLADFQQEGAEARSVCATLTTNCFSAVRARLLEMDRFFGLLSGDAAAATAATAATPVAGAAAPPEVHDAAVQHKASLIVGAVKLFINTVYRYPRLNGGAPTWAVPLVGVDPDTRMISIEHAYTQFCAWLRSIKHVPSDLSGVQAARDLDRISAGAFCAAIMKGFAHHAQYHITLDERKHYLIGERHSGAVITCATSVPTPPAMPTTPFSPASGTAKRFASVQPHPPAAHAAAITAAAILADSPTAGAISPIAPRTSVDLWPLSPCEPTFYPSPDAAARDESPALAATAAEPTAHLPAGAALWPTAVGDLTPPRNLLEGDPRCRAPALSPAHLVAPPSRSIFQPRTPDVGCDGACSGATREPLRALTPTLTDSTRPQSHCEPPRAPSRPPLARLVLPSPPPTVPPPSLNPVDHREAALPLSPSQQHLPAPLGALCEPDPLSSPGKRKRKAETSLGSTDDDNDDDDNDNDEGDDDANVAPSRSDRAGPTPGVSRNRKQKAKAPPRVETRHATDESNSDDTDEEHERDGDSAALIRVRGMRMTADRRHISMTDLLASAFLDSRESSLRALPAGPAAKRGKRRAATMSLQAMPSPPQGSGDELAGSPESREIACAVIRAMGRANPFMRSYSKLSDVTSCALISAGSVDAFILAAMEQASAVDRHSARRLADYHDSPHYAGLLADLGNPPSSIGRRRSAQRAQTLLQPNKARRQGAKKARSDCAAPEHGWEMAVVPAATPELRPRRLAARRSRRAVAVSAGHKQGTEDANEAMPQPNVAPVAAPTEECRNKPIASAGQAPNESRPFGTAATLGVASGVPECSVAAAPDYTPTGMARIRPTLPTATLPPPAVPFAVPSGTEHAQRTGDLPSARQVETPASAPPQQPLRRKRRTEPDENDSLPADFETPSAPAVGATMRSDVKRQRFNETEDGTVADNDGDSHSTKDGACATRSSANDHLPMGADAARPTPRTGPNDGANFVEPAPHADSHAAGDPMATHATIAAAERAYDLALVRHAIALNMAGGAQCRLVVCSHAGGVWEERAAYAPRPGQPTLPWLVEFDSALSHCEGASSGPLRPRRWIDEEAMCDSVARQLRSPDCVVFVREDASPPATPECCITLRDTWRYVQAAWLATHSGTGQCAPLRYCPVRSASRAGRASASESQLMAPAEPATARLGALHLAPPAKACACLLRQADSPRAQAACEENPPCDRAALADYVANSLSEIVRDSPSGAGAVGECVALVRRLRADVADATATAEALPARH